MAVDYVEQRDSSFYLRGTRVPLACIVREYRNGESAEAIQSHFPVLSVEQVYGAIAFYLSRKEEADRDVLDRDREEDAFSVSHPPPPELKRKLDLARMGMQSHR